MPYPWYEPDHCTAGLPLPIVWRTAPSPSYSSVSPPVLTQPVPVQVHPRTRLVRFRQRCVPVKRGL